MSEPETTTSLLTTFIPFLFIGLPFFILNIIMSKRKGKSTLKYALLSLIPFVGFSLMMYLLSFLDKDVEDKIKEIHEELIKNKIVNLRRRTIAST